MTELQDASERHRTTRLPLRAFPPQVDAEPGTEILSNSEATMRISSYLPAAMLPVLFAAAIPATAAAQQPSSSAARADALYQRAAQLEQEQSDAPFARQVRRIARLYLESASLREVSDPLKIEGLYRAGNLLYTVNPRRSHEVLAEAAELALIHGQVALSAGAFLDAAAVVQTKRQRSTRDREAAMQYVETARLLAEHPVLDEDARDAILSRIDLRPIAIYTP